MHNFLPRKNRSKILATYVTFKNIHKANTRPIRENSPNLVALNLPFLFIFCHFYFEIRLGTIDTER
jgi:hypothetical protein